MEMVVAVCVLGLLVATDGLSEGLKLGWSSIPVATKTPYPDQRTRLAMGAFSGF
jgi:hypothetical protein